MTHADKEGNITNIAVCVYRVTGIISPPKHCKRGTRGEGCGHQLAAVE